MIVAGAPGKILARRGRLRRRVLVVDDEPLIRWALSTGLAAAGFDAIAPADSAEARAAVSASPPPDVLLLDLHTGDCTALLEDVRGSAPHCHVLVLGTCCDGRPGMWQGLEIIAKPFDLDDVVRRVEAAADGRVQDVKNFPSPLKTS